MAARILETIRALVTGLVANVAFATVPFGLAFISTTLVLVDLIRQRFGFSSLCLLGGLMLLGNKEFCLAGFGLTAEVFPSSDP